MSLIKIITIVATLVAGLTGGYLYTQQKPTDQNIEAEALNQLTHQPTVQPGTIDSSDAQSFSSSDLNRLRRHKN
jgi:uncharacterized membrane protein YraQ (UPF0718 family)